MSVCVSTLSPSTSSFFFNDTATTEIYTLSLHDALPIWVFREKGLHGGRVGTVHLQVPTRPRSEEHTSELQSQSNRVCRLLLEKKKNKIYKLTTLKKKKQNKKKKSKSNKT